MGKITNKGKLDTSTLQAELDAASPKRGNSNGQKLKDIIVRQSNLPEGSVRLRVLPPVEDMKGLPWVRTEEHFFYDKNTKDIASYISTGRNDPGQQLAERMIKAGRERDGKGWQAKTKLRMNVVFTGWTDGVSATPVPEEYQGVRIFEFGRGVWRGTHKTETGGFLKLLQDAQTNGTPPFYDETDGCEIVLTKSGSGLETNYTVELATNLMSVDVGGRKIQTHVPDVGPVHKDPNEVQKFLKGRHNLQVFLRTKTLEEIQTALEPFRVMVEAAERAANSRNGATSTPKKFSGGRTLQEELDDDLPPSFG